MQLRLSPTLVVAMSLLVSPYATGATEADASASDVDNEAVAAIASDRQANASDWTSQANLSKQRLYIFDSKYQEYVDVANLSLRRRLITPSSDIIAAAKSLYKPYEHYLSQELVEKTVNASLAGLRHVYFGASIVSYAKQLAGLADGLIFEEKQRLFKDEGKIVAKSPLLGLAGYALGNIGYAWPVKFLGASELCFEFGTGPGFDIDLDSNGEFAKSNLRWMFYPSVYLNTVGTGPIGLNLARVGLLFSVDPNSQLFVNGPSGIVIQISGSPTFNF